MVQLKDLSYAWRSTMGVFQFLMVQLKELNRNTIYVQIKFQFLMVQLKVRPIF